MSAVTRTEQDRLLGIPRDELYVAVVSDVLDAGGLLNPEEPYRLEIEAVDALQPGDVMVASTSLSQRTCSWGELLSTAAVARGATGRAIDGHVRDALRIMEMGFPVFATGYRPVDSSSRATVVCFGCPVEVGGVVVRPGDISSATTTGSSSSPRPSSGGRDGRAR